MINNIFAYIRNDICSFPCLSVYPSEYEIISILSLIIHLLVFTWNYSCSLPWLIACFFAYDSLPFSHYPSFHLYVKLFLFLYSTTHEFLPLRNYPRLFPGLHMKTSLSPPVYRHIYLHVKVFAFLSRTVNIFVRIWVSNITSILTTSLNNHHISFPGYRHLVVCGIYVRSNHTGPTEWQASQY